MRYVPGPAPVSSPAAADMAELADLLRLYRWFKDFEEHVEDLAGRGMRPSEGEMRQYHRLRAEFLHRVELVARGRRNATPPAPGASGARRAVAGRDQTAGAG
ncbi:hypothetical protein SRB5_02790 [Streptomyces sp. RB5]|uniref:Uncharacterized protein n=1 Tax=Streptomyces smaragdinus TaxID=2585196 RepID=A0A7K0CAK2_9ACTN|nr:hypothetical protein [Streptomyces smaragdinus]MQY10172.1 hypothetical protein [Streptomyces smaragdinus]